MNIDVKTWIIEWLNENTVVKEDEIKSGLHDNYFEKGWIDSFQFISFISDIEERFNFNFSNDEFQDRNFSTVEGLVKIIEEKIYENQKKI